MLPGQYLQAEVNLHKLEQDWINKVQNKHELKSFLQKEIGQLHDEFRKAGCPQDTEYNYARLELFDFPKRATCHYIRSKIETLHALVTELDTELAKV